MAETRAQSAIFANLVQEFIDTGNSFRFQARGRSMWPTIRDGEFLHVKPIDKRRLKLGDIVLFRREGVFKAHRIIRRKRDFVLIRGDACIDSDGWIAIPEILGRVASAEGRDGRTTFGSLERLQFFCREAYRRLRRLKS
jgi:signal peptidase I